MSSGIQRLLCFLCEAVQQRNEAGSPLICESRRVSAPAQCLRDANRLRYGGFEHDKGWFVGFSLVPHEVPCPVMLIDWPSSSDQNAGQVFRAFQRAALSNLSAPKISAK